MWNGMEWNGMDRNCEKNERGAGMGMKGKGRQGNII